MTNAGVAVRIHFLHISRTSSGKKIESDNYVAYFWDGTHHKILEKGTLTFLFITDGQFARAMCMKF